MLTEYSILRALQSEKSIVAKRRFFLAEQPILAEGATGSFLYLIESGRVRITTRIELKGRRHIRPGLRDLGPGDVLGELALFDDAPQITSAVTVEDTELLEFEVEDLLAYLDRHPDQGYVFLQRLLQSLTRHLRQADLRLKSLFAWGLEAHGIDKYL